MPKKTINSLEEEIASLKTQLETQKEGSRTEIEELKSSNEQTLGELTRQHEEKRQQLEGNIKNIEIQIDDLERQVDDKQKQLDLRELKKLAEAYAEQESQFRKGVKVWFIVVLIAFGIVALATIAIAQFVNHQIWYQNIGYYFADVVLVTFLVFSLKQYSYYTKLSTDYATRKVIAQSYHNIIGSEEDTVIKSKFIEKATEVLCARAEISDETYTIPEKLVESLTEIAKNLSRK